MSSSTSDALAAVANSIALATFALAVIVSAATVGWFFYVRHRTREEAKAEVEKVAPAHINAYLDKRLNGMVADALAAMTLTSDMDRSPPLSGQEQGEALSDKHG